MSKTKLILATILVLTLAAGNAWQYWLKPKPMAPELIVTSIKGDKLSLQGLQGKPVLVSFWATSCGLCLAEIDDLIALHNDYQAKGYTTLAIALSYDSLPQIKAITENNPLPFTVIYDQNGDYAKAFGGVMMTPTHFLISPDGHIVWNNVGMVERDTLQALIEPLLL